MYLTKARRLRRAFSLHLKFLLNRRAIRRTPCNIGSKMRIIVPKTSKMDTNGSKY